MLLKSLVNLGRFKEIVSVLVKYGFGDLIASLDLPGQTVADKIMSIDPGLSPFERFRMALDDLGPTFVKFGQIMSMRSELLPQALLTELQKLQDDASPVDVEVIKEAIRQNLKAPWDEVFLSFDPKPLAAASLSQVHRAVLKDGRTEVALKVQRPNIEKKIDQDLSILKSVAARMHERMSSMRVYELPSLVELIRKTLERELDFYREARYLAVARNYMEDLEGIHIPKAFLDLSTPQLLVMDYVRGHNLKTINRNLLDDPAGLARTGLRATVRQLFEVGFFHGDPHPGNMLLSDDNTLNLLDWGMVGRLTPRDRFEMVDMVAAIVEKDSQRLVDALLTITAGGVETDRRALERDLLDILDAHLVASVSELRLGRLVMEITDMMRRYQLRIPPDLMMMIKSLVTAEGTVRLIYPELDIVSEIRPHLKRVSARRLDPAILWHSMTRSLFRLVAAPSRFPRRIADIVEKMEQGILRIRFEHHNLHGMEKTLEKTFSRLTMGVILAAMIIGSSLIITTGIPPLFHGYPALGLAGYLISGLLGLWLVYDILRSR